jgi:CheY-specific phosphatase CheX
MNSPSPQNPESQPQKVKTIAKLVDSRDQAPMEEIAKIIDGDHAITQPLMVRAFPRAPAREGATVQMATSRVGINYVIVLAISDLLRQYVVEVFQTMANLTLTKDDVSAITVDESEYLAGIVRFKGKANGKVSFMFSSALSLIVADRLLEAGSELSPESLQRSVTDIVEAIADRLASGLNEGRLPCTVETPEIYLRTEMPEEETPKGTTEELYFHHGATAGLRVILNVAGFTAR